MPKFPCKICSKSVAKTHKAVCCDLCNIWVHIKCNKINAATYNMLLNDETKWFCIECSKDIFPFSSLNDVEFFSTTQGKKIKFLTKTKLRPANEEILINKLNDAMNSSDLSNPNTYYNIDNFNQSFKSNTMNGFNLLHLNISSLPYHREQFHTFLSDIDIDFDIIGITETKLKTGKKPLNSIDIEHYVSEHTTTDSNAGGALLYIKEGITYKVRNDLAIIKSTELESIFIEIQNSRKRKNVIVGCIYRHPCMDATEFNDLYLQVLLDKLALESKDVYIMGDFNINLLQYDDKKESQEFLDKMHSNFLLPYISSPSRVTPRSQTLIDNIFSNKVEVESFSGNITTSISDHYAQFLLLKKQNLPKGQKQRKMIRDYKKIEIEKETVEADLDTTNWKQNLKLNQGNVHNSFAIFFETFDKAIEKHAPLRKMSIQEQRLTKRPWITSGILKSIKTKDKLRRKFDRAKDPLRKTALENEYKKYKNQLEKILKTSKALYYQKFFENNKTNLYKTWNGIKEIININKKQKQHINSLTDDNNQIINNPKLIAEQLNKHFSNIAKAIEAEIPPSKNTFQDYLKNPLQNTLFLTPTTKKEVMQQIKTLKNNKAIGPHSIPTKLFKSFSKSLSEPLTDLINLSFSKGVFPDILKLAQVMAAFKKGDKTDKNNYRPISLISNVSKILEKLMYKRIYVFLEQNNSFYPYQFGFRHNHSTNSALIEITEQIRKACDKGSFACGVYLDFKKAFDTVNHHILLKKLEHYGIRGITNDWLCSFLTNRKQYTSVDGNDSTTQEITHGVPQGSVLGPLLFIIFINDLNISVKSSKVHHFADDTNLLLIGKSLKKINSLINHDLALLVQWLRANKISLNTSKTEIVIFRPKHKLITKNLNFRVSGEKIKPSSTVKYLGVILQEHLEWQKHINTLAVKLNRAAGLLSKIQHYVPKFLLRTIYYSVFNSHLIYTCQIWGQKESAIKKLSEIQDKAIRIINFKDKHYPANELYLDNKILKISDYIKLSNCLFIKDILSNNELPIFKDFFKKTTQSHSHLTRHAARNSVNLPQPQTDQYGKYSILYQTAATWNKLQDKLEIDMLEESKEKVKAALLKFYLNNYVLD